MSFQTGNYRNIPYHKINVTLKKITPEHVAQSQTLHFFSENYLAKSAKFPNTYEGFGLWTDNGEPVGRIWVTYRGGSTGLCNVKTIDAYIGGVFVSEKFRRNGCCEYMLSNLLQYLHDRKNINTAYLLVRKNNLPARGAYKKLGGIEEALKPMLSFCKIKIPFNGFVL